MTNLTGRTAVVTGASSGIGAATARKLAAAGARVALLARREDRLTELAQDIKAAGGEALAVAADATSATSVSEAALRVASTFGGVDLVVNNAGVMLPAPVAERRVDYWQREIDTNVTGALRIIEAFLPSLEAAAADGRPADLVNVSSIAAQYVFPNLAVYNATKAAVSHLSRTMRQELGPRGIRVTAVEPGLVATELQGHGTDAGISAWIEEARKSIEWLSADDIAEVIAFTAAQPKRVNLAQITIFPTEQA